MHEFCTLRACTNSTDSLLPTLYPADRCPYAERTPRQKNLMAHLEQRANQENPLTGGLLMYPPHDFTETLRCSDWFYTFTPASVVTLAARYASLRVPTTGIASSIHYSPIMLRQRAGGNQRRYLVIYACSTLNPYRLEVTTFNLQRMREALGQDTFIIMVDTVPTQYEHPLADVVIHADFISPDTFYDSSAMQEGLLEAYRLFGLDLLGFYGLLVINDSLIGPLTTAIGAALPSLQQDEPAVVSLGVWIDHVMTGAGFLLNRPAFLTPSFSDYWRYTRFPCGKFGSMLLYEAYLHHLFSAAGTQCYTLTNDIMALDTHPSEWGSRALPFYKHKNSKDQEAVQRYMASPPASPTPASPTPASLERCRL